MTESRLEAQTLALAGVAQCAELVQGLARTGKIDQDYLSNAVKSLFAFEADSMGQVYGGARALKPGLRAIESRLFNPATALDREIMRYCLQLIQLAKKIKGSGKRSQQLASRLQALHQQGNIHPDALDDDMLAQIAKVYVESVSPLQPRIIVNGEQGYLAQEQTAVKVRVCLLCGIRSAYLWLQKGGGRLQLLTGRGRYRNQAASILAEMV